MVRGGFNVDGWMYGWLGRVMVWPGEGKTDIGRGEDGAKR